MDHLDVPQTLGLGLLLRDTPRAHEIERGVAHLGHFFVPLFFVAVPESELHQAMARLRADLLADKKKGYQLRVANLGTLVIQGNVPCIRCGHGDDCPMSGIKMLHGPDASVASVGVKTFEEDSALVAAAKELAEKLREAVVGEPASQSG